MLRKNSSSIAGIESTRDLSQFHWWYNLLPEYKHCLDTCLSSLFARSFVPNCSYSTIRALFSLNLGDLVLNFGNLDLHDCYFYLLAQLSLWFSSLIIICNILRSPSKDFFIFRSLSSLLLNHKFLSTFLIILPWHPVFSFPFEKEKKQDRHSYALFPIEFRMSLDPTFPLTGQLMFIRLMVRLQ